MRDLITSPLALLAFALLAVGIAYAISLVLAVRFHTSTPGPMSGRASAVDGGLRVELRVERGPRGVTVQTISLGRETAARADARPPPGFRPAPAEPLPDLEAFEADLDELALDYPDGDIPAEVLERERRKQYEAWRGLSEADEATTVRWHGRLRVRRSRVSEVLIPMRAEAAAGGAVVFGLRYRIGLVGVADAYKLPIGGPPAATGP